MPATVPCQYRTGKTLGSGTYAIVKEAIHITTGKYYACKVINKKLMEGREHMVPLYPLRLQKTRLIPLALQVRNEIAVLKKISSGHPNIVTLHDYFETAHNLYLVFDLCTGGELFDRICAKGNYYEADAADLVRTIFKAVEYIHNSGVVHRGMLSHVFHMLRDSLAVIYNHSYHRYYLQDLKPENLLFKTQAEEAAIMIADFGLSRVMEEEKFSLLTEICGTPGYMAPEIFKRTGHGKPVDVWAMGVITYFLLAGYTPFDRESQQQEMEAIIAGDYKFEPAEYWENVSETAKDFVRTCLTIDPNKRPTATEALAHKWLADKEPHFVANPADGTPADLLPNVKRAFNAKRAWKKAAYGIRAMNRMASLASGGLTNPEAALMRENLDKYKAESEKEDIQTASITYMPQHTPVTAEFPAGSQKSATDDELQKKLANATIQG
ncbi:CAMK/CAMK1 protein kinase [Coprinopsis cinerea okayama7|uniref:CAMK/CAMK1 protein kinase n=1 Tax=Coprinopsis cinerea (strain Okayama-7 / 130 / ATCC MYA-4618 / FGSC 9003) TaxID=240176 RepID=A8NZC7_COPC7|nr:CAMK/CAMK1 protein kinase [Coprinopsis cinerea okayama7\|eukprot:XP_001837649.2 CAMK/CAMK1 protein kinase [Coprinopsis cinerea okayama7\